MKKTLNYKGVKVNQFGVPIFLTKSSEPKNKTVRGYTEHKYFKYNFGNNAQKDMIVMYDIPKQMKKERDWFRRHLKTYDYVMIQKSVWVGPSPLPRDFLDYVKSINLLDNLITLKLAKPYKKGDKNI
jgi:DNA-binding transcriptional regulator PaaX